MSPRLNFRTRRSHGCSHAGPHGAKYILRMSSRPLDTAPVAWSHYEAVLDGPARFRAAMELSEAVRELRLAGIRSRHPELTHEEVVARLMWEDRGVELPRRK